MSKELYWCTLGNHPQRGGFSQNLGFLPIAAEDVVECCYFEFKPKQLLGFPTAQERDRMQHTALNAPIPKLKQALEDLRPRVLSGEVIVIDLD
ncbi:MAG: hypothetical protein ACRCZF_13835 [Gemmataceae bacterium]